MAIALISHSECLLHNMGMYHPEQPLRLKAIEDALYASSYNDYLVSYEAPMASEAQLVRVHAKNYLDEIFQASPKDGLIAFAPDVYMNPYSVTAALRAAGSGVLAVDLVMSSEVGQAFCNVRPPGHHAEYDKAMGFCFFNNVAVAIAHALQTYQLERVALVDFDVHHGNGTETIFKKEKRVLYCSSFQYPFYPFSGAHTVSSHIINVPLKAYTSSEVFRQKTEEAWFNKMREFAPELIFFSVGFDAYVGDEIANLLLTEDDYFWLTRKIKEIANECCNGRIVSLLEGGYSLKGLASCAVAHIHGLLI